MTIAPRTASGRSRSRGASAIAVKRINPEATTANSSVRARLVTGRRLAPGDSTDHTSGQAIGAKDVLVSEDTLCRGVHKMV
jgi:hypothetical protein